MCSSTRGPAIAPLLGHMADEEHRAARRLGHAHQQAGAFAHLRNAAGRAGHVRTVHRLDRVDNHVIRRDFLPSGVRPHPSRFAEDEQVVARHAQPPRARILIWRTDSSPEIYSTRAPPRARCSDACSKSVDLPMPGSPPTSISDPSTTPPPSTRSNSPIPVVARALVSSGDFGKAHGACARSRPLLVRFHGIAACCAACGACSLERIPTHCSRGICPSSAAFRSRRRCTQTPSFPSP